MYSRYRELDIVLGIASGLAYLHGQNVIHGDVKAANVLLDSSINPLLCDYDMYNARDSNTGSSWAGAGAWKWMSPELMQDNNARRDAKSDVYAFAMTIVEILTGNAPFPKANFFKTVQEVINGRRPECKPLKREDQDFDQLWRAAKACWDADPTKRPSADDVMNLLRNGDSAPPRGVLNPSSPSLLRSKPCYIFMVLASTLFLFLCGAGLGPVGRLVHLAVSQRFTVGQVDIGCAL